jgi:hypothetical protein
MEASILNSLLILFQTLYRSVISGVSLPLHFETATTTPNGKILPKSCFEFMFAASNIKGREVYHC